MRRRVLVLLPWVVLAAGCGGGGEPAARTEPPKPGSLAAILARPGADVAVVPGDGDFSPGRVRISFLVVRNDGSLVDRPAARFWIGRSLASRPFQEVRAVRESVGTPTSEPDPLDVEHLYVAHVTVPKTGRYFFVAEPIGASRPIQALWQLDVKAHTTSPEVGEDAIGSRTPTLDGVGGDASLITTREPPDTELLRYSVRQSLQAHVPFVLVFATPKFCTSRTCGPVVDVVDAVRTRFAGTPVRFIHVEVYEGNDPARGYNRWMKEWGLRTEPYVFLVGRDGKIKAKFEGAFSVRELTAAVRAHLAQRT